MATVCPSAITMSSVVAGTVPPGHGALLVVELQFPEPAVVTVAANAATLRSAMAENSVNKTKRVLFISLILSDKCELSFGRICQETFLPTKWTRGTPSQKSPALVYSSSQLIDLSIRSKKIRYTKEVGKPYSRPRNRDVPSGREAQK